MEFRPATRYDAVRVKDDEGGFTETPINPETVWVAVVLDNTEVKMIFDSRENIKVGDLVKFVRED